MKFFNKVIAGGLAAIMALFVMAVIGTGRVSAACNQYDPNATTPTTPVFNNICNVPNGVGNEPDFVRIRKSTNGNNEDNQNNPTYANSLSDACVAGSKYDVWTYIHNNAVSGYNDNGAGSAVAHNVMLAMTAPLGTTNTNFNFMSAVSASNAAGVQDTATLNCGTHSVKLTLVPTTVHIYSQQYNWNNLPDSAVNGTTKIGSPTLGSGDQWGCWEYRVVVVYQVTVNEIPTPPTPSTGSCKAVDVTTDNASRKVSVKVNGEVSNAQIIGYQIDFGDGMVVNQQTATHTYAKDGTYVIVTRVQVKFADGHTEWLTSTACTKQVTFKNNVPVTPVTPTTPSELPNTGAGDILGIFAATTIAGAFVHRMRGRLFNRG